VGHINQALSDFNNALQHYQQGCIKKSCNTTTYNDGKCDYENVVQPFYNKLIGIIDEINKQVPDGDFKTLANQDGSMNEIQINYKSLLTLRENIDEKMKRLNQNYVGKNDHFGNFPTNEVLDINTYTNVLWAILGTSLVYFIFLKIKD
jgi:hypothetical protein